MVALSLTQGVIGPLIATASDAFQARKFILVVVCTISFIGACIAPGSSTIYRLIGANVLIGFGFAAVPLTYAVPSEILPRRWRPCKCSTPIPVWWFTGADNGALSRRAGHNKQRCPICRSIRPLYDCCSHETQCPYGMAFVLCEPWTTNLRTQKIRS